MIVRVVDRPNHRRLGAVGPATARDHQIQQTHVNTRTTICVTNPPTVWQAPILLTAPQNSGRTATQVTAGPGAFANSCTHANDGMCDEPYFCQIGTDQADCLSADFQGQSNSNSGASNGYATTPPSGVVTHTRMMASVTNRLTVPTGLMAMIVTKDSIRRF